MAQPSGRMVSILRAASLSPIEVVGPHPFEFAYDGGETVRDANSRPITTRAFCRWVREGWLVPVEVGRYRSRILSDPAIEAPIKPEDDMSRQLPTPQQVAVLRRVASHKLVAQFRDGRKEYAYGDGLPVKRQDAERLIARGWVRPESPGLFRDEDAQTYTAIPA